MIIKMGIVGVSEVSLGIYLVSSIFDGIFYKTLCEKIPVMVDRLKYFLIIVPAVFICSFVLAMVLKYIYIGLYECVVVFRNKYMQIRR